MKIKFVLDDTIDDQCIVISSKTDNQYIHEIKQFIETIENHKLINQIEVSYREKKLFIDINEILFFQSFGRDIYAHTIDKQYRIGYKLYELEDLFSNQFIRVSKSAIVNINKVYGLEKSLTINEISFKDCHKALSISRNYYKIFKDKLKEKRK